MSSTNKTPKLKLSQWNDLDKPTFLGDLNSDMLAIDKAVTANETASTTALSQATTALTKATTAETNVNVIKTDITTLQNKNTTQDTSINNAQTTATSAQNTATSAQTTANTAATKADNAKNAADTAYTKASTAETTANTAKFTADTALTNANSALSKLANKKVGIKTITGRGDALVKLFTLAELRTMFNNQTATSNNFVVNVAGNVNYDISSQRVGSSIYVPNETSWFCYAETTIATGENISVGYNVWMI